MRKAMMVPLRIEVSSAARAADLLVYLRALGADARKEGASSIKVMRRHAVVPGEPSYQDRIEIEFILRAWASGHADTRYEVEEAA